MLETATVGRKMEMMCVDIRLQANIISNSMGIRTRFTTFLIRGFAVHGRESDR